MSKKFHHHAKLLAGVLLLTIFVLQTVSVTILVHEHRKTQKQVNINTVEARVAQTLASTSSVDEHYRRPQIEAVEKRIYFPELGVWLPMNVQTTDIRYRVTDKTGGGTIDAVFTTGSNLQIYGFDDTVDRCNELVRIEIGAESAEPGIGEVGLPPVRFSDGTQSYIHYYTEGKDLCEWFIDTPQEIAQMLTQFQTY